MALSDLASGLCARHAAAHKKDRDAANLAAQLIGDTQEFTSAVLLRTLPAIEHELEVIEGPPQLDFSDWLRNDRRQSEVIRVLPDIPRPDRSQPHTDVVYPTTLPGQASPNSGNG